MKLNTFPSELEDKTNSPQFYSNISTFCYFIIPAKHIHNYLKLITFKFYFHKNLYFHFYESVI